MAIKVGDRVRLLPGGAVDTCARPPLVEGNVYTVEEVRVAGLLIRLQGPGSFVFWYEVEVVPRTNADLLIGDRVTLSPDTEWDRSPGNPRDCEGTVIPAPLHNERVWVRWDNGFANSYRARDNDLTPVKPSLVVRILNLLGFKI